MDNYTGRSFDGRVVSGEFVFPGDEDGRSPGTYVTILLDDPKAGLAGGPARITYLPLERSHNKPRGLSAGEAPSAETVNSNTSTSQAIASGDEGRRP